MTCKSYTVLLGLILFELRQAFKLYKGNLIKIKSDFNSLLINKSKKF